MTRRDIIRSAILLTALSAAGGYAMLRETYLSNPVAASPNDPEFVSHDAKKARAAFNEAAKVFFSPRCANCHPAGDAPLQGDNGRPHDNDVTRGPKGLGTEELACALCHQETNTEGDGMPPGVPGWQMPPADMKMVFPGLTAAQLCRNLKDPKMNGGHKTAKDAVKHIETDPRVRWAWSPGNNRTTPPMSFESFVKKVNEWVANGAACPE